MAIDQTISKAAYSAVDTRLLANAIFSIDNKEVDFKSLTVEQTYGQHHEFTVIVPFGLFNTQAFASRIEEPFNLVGKRATIEFAHGFDWTNSNYFRGIITNVELVGENGDDGYMLIQGISRTILLEKGKHHSVYSNLTLSQIIDEIVKDSKDNFKQDVSNKPTYDTPLEIAIQYNESDWEFLKRLCYQYGVNMFYNGSMLLFGKYEEKQPVSLMYGADITKLNIGSKLLPNKFQNTAYDAQNDSELVQESSDTNTFKSNFIKRASQNNELLHSKYPIIQPYTVPPAGIGEMTDITEAYQSRLAGQTVYVKGESKTIKAMIGETITIATSEGAGLGTYRVVKLKHIIDQDHRYHNEFEAVPASLPTIPVEEPAMPVVNSLRAVVTSTDDPLNQGRVQVQFPFSDNRVEIWLRVMTPDAGSTANGEKNRGILFIPEKDTQVMVDFEMNNPNFPYVAGALFHGKNGQGGSDKNTTKSIVTRSGIQIVFNDEEKSLHIQDANGCIWNMDGKGNIEVTAPESFTINTKTININATEDMNVVARNISEGAESITYQVKKEVSFEADKFNAVLNKLTATTTGNASIISSAKMEVKGATIDLAQGSGSQSPKSSQAVSQLPATTAKVTEAVFEQKDDNEREGANPKIVSIKLLDDSGTETDILGRSTNVEVETSGMAGRDLDLILIDKETGNEINVGSFYIPTNDYVVNTKIRNKEDYTID